MPSNTLVCFRLVCFFLQRLIQPFFITFWASQKESLWTTSQGGSPQASDTVKPNGSSLEIKLWNLLPKNTVNKVCSVHIQRLKFAGFWMFCPENIYFSVCSNIYFSNLFHSFGAGKQSILNYWLGFLEGWRETMNSVWTLDAVCHSACKCMSHTHEPVHPIATTVHCL